MYLYEKVRELLSEKNKSRVSKLLYITNIKPRINNKKQSCFSKGIVVFSADFEMSWAFRYSKSQNHNAIKLGLQERENLPIFLNLFEKYKIPVTWATVGHLFLDKCAKNKEGRTHEEMPRPFFFENRNWIYKSGDWYEHDSGSNVLKNPEWYASDLIDKIIESKIPHEIGCHTFSHIDCSYDNCSKELLDAELKMCKKLANNKNITLKSFVFPGGTFGNYESLVENEFVCYRKPMKNHIDIPYIDKFGLVAIPSSLGLGRDSFGWTQDFHKKIIISFIKKTISSKQVSHFWFHPSMCKWYLKNVFPFVIQLVAKEAKNGRLEVKTMGALANDLKNMK